jgi:hypothetical protein
VEARGLELVADQPEAQEPASEIVLGAGGAEFAFLAGGGSGGQGLGGDGQAELDVGLDLPGVERGFEVAELDRAPVPDVVQVDPVVAVMLSST